MKRVATGLGLIAFLMMLAGGSLSAQVGERPRDTDYTEDAEDAIEDAEDTDDEAEKQAYYRMALEHAQGEIAENPNNPLGHRLAALASLGLKQYADAGAYFDRAQELYPLYEFEDSGIRESTWIALYNEASPLVGSGDYGGAVEIFEDAHAIFQARPEIMITVAQLYGSLGDFERSLHFMNEVDAFMASETAANTDSVTMAGWKEQAGVLPLLKAQVLAADGQSDLAADAYRALMEMGNEVEATAVYMEMMDMPGLDSETLFSIGVGFYQSGDYDNAAEAFGNASTASVNDRDALEMWARSLQLDSAFAAIPPVAERWIGLDPNGQNAWLILAQAANQLEDTETTRDAVQSVDALEFTVNDLQLRRFGNGGAEVNGSVINKKLSQGDSVTLRFTFYATDGAPIGSVTQTVTVGGVDMAQVFNVQFDSAEQVGGYGYRVN